MSQETRAGAGPQRPAPAGPQPSGLGGPQPSGLGGGPANPVRESYDTVAGDYADLLRTELAGKPFDRAMLAAFADLVRANGAGPAHANGAESLRDGANGAGPVADLGCGPGRVTVHLHELGLDAFGVDLSPGMVAVARRDHPHLRFDVGSIDALDLGEGVLAGAVAWYSIIHTPTPQLPQVFAEFRRVLAPGGPLLLAFQADATGADDVTVHLERAYGHSLSLDVHLRSPDVVAELLRRAGFEVHARLLREPEAPEKSRQAYVMAR